MDENDISIEWLILADAAEVANGKVFIMGAGWTVYRVPAFPAQIQAHLVLAVSIPWTLTNREHNFEIEIVDEDGRKLSNVKAGLEVGRPVGLSVGEAQRVPVALGFGVTVPKSGTYVISVRNEEHEYARTTFKVVQVTNAPPTLTRR